MEQFYQYIQDTRPKDKKVYLFFDEVQLINGWEKAINSFRVDFPCYIYITGSNASSLSSEFATLLAGRYVEIKVYPLSFREFLDFHQFTVERKDNLVGGTTIQMVRNGTLFSAEEALNGYVYYGGFPGIKSVGLTQQTAFPLIDSIYRTVAARDIIGRDQLRGERKITDADLLDRIATFLADNIGNPVSATTIGNVLNNEGLVEHTRKAPSANTVQAYVKALVDTFIFYEAKRYDIKGKDYLRTLGKFYIADLGLRNNLLGYRNIDMGHILENVVYFELLRRGYDVSIGKIKNFEVDFVATKFDEKLYIQVTQSMQSETVRDRELWPLDAIQDSYPKLVLSTDRDINADYDGVQHVNVVEWLLQ